MCSKFVPANWICLAKSLKMVGKWPMADCYFKFCIVIMALVYGMRADVLVASSLQVPNYHNAVIVARHPGVTYR